MGKWYSRPVLFVADVDVALEFYGRLGFAEAWRFAKDDAPNLPTPATRTGPNVDREHRWRVCPAPGSAFG